MMHIREALGTHEARLDELVSGGTRWYPTALGIVRGIWNGLRQDNPKDSEAL